MAQAVSLKRTRRQKAVSDGLKAIHFSKWLAETVQAALTPQDFEMLHDLAWEERPQGQRDKILHFAARIEALMPPEPNPGPPPMPKPAND